jgi:hypothetical protein
MKAVESEVEKVRAVRRAIAEQFNFDAVRLGEHYRHLQAAMKRPAASRRESSAAAVTVKEAPNG